MEKEEKSREEEFIGTTFSYSRMGLTDLYTSYMDYSNGKKRGSNYTPPKKKRKKRK